MKSLSVGIWGDSVLKGVVYDDRKIKYTLLPECAVNAVSETMGLKTNNRARMGCTITKGLSILERDLQHKEHYDAAVIEFGGNDCDYQWQEIAELPMQEHQPHTPLTLFRDSLIKMIHTVKQAGILPIIMTLPPIDAQRYFHFFTRGGLNQDNILYWLGDIDHIFRWHAEYNQIVVDVAQGTGCDIVDVRKSFIQTGNYQECLCSDGIHPNEKGQAIIRSCFEKFASAFV